MARQSRRPNLPHITGDTKQDFENLIQALYDEFGKYAQWQDMAPAIFAAGDVLFSNTELDTAANNGFGFVPRCAGTPTGTPTNYNAGVPLVYDYTNKILYLYDYTAAAWTKVGASMFGITPKANGLIAPVGKDWGNTLAGGNIATVTSAIQGYYDTTANTTSATLVDVINYTGSGVCDFLAHFAQITVAGQCKVIVDGVTVLDLTTSAKQWYNIIGSTFPVSEGVAAAADSDVWPVTPGTPIAFSTSFQVQHKVASGANSCYTLLRMHKIT